MLAALYAALGKLCLATFGSPHPNASPVWLLTGLSIAALLIAGYRVWPAVFVGAFVANITTAGSFATSLAIGTGNALEAIVAAVLVNRFAGGRKAFDDATSVLRFAALAALASPVLSATFGVGSLVLDGYVSAQAFLATWFTWWLGNVASAMIVTPLLLLWYANPRLNWTLHQAVEAVLLLDVLVLTGLVAFLDPEQRAYPLVLLCIPSLIWAALRFGPREAATAVAVLSAIATAATTLGKAPFPMPNPTASLLALQGFMTLLALTALSLAALNGERNALLARERALRTEAESANRAKDEFLAVLSHELRNPLEAITAAESALDTEPAGSMEHQNRWRAIIRRQTRHLTRLIDDLLDVSRVTASKLQLERNPMDLGAAAAQCVHALCAGSAPARPQIRGKPTRHGSMATLPASSRSSATYSAMR